MKGPLFGLGEIKTISNLCFFIPNSMLASLPICSSWKLKMGYHLFKAPSSSRMSFLYADDTKVILGVFSKDERIVKEQQGS